MLAIAFESVVKLVAIVGVGIFVSWGLFDGIGELTVLVGHSPNISAIVDRPPAASMWISLIVTTLTTVFFLPQQFHVSVVETATKAMCAQPRGSSRSISSP